MDIQHRLKYVIEFENQVDYFNVILQKQIDTRLKFEGNENYIIVVDLNCDNKRLNDKTFFTKYKIHWMERLLYYYINKYEKLIYI